MLTDRSSIKAEGCDILIYIYIYIYIYTHTHTHTKTKRSHYRLGVAQRVGRGIALLFNDRGTRRG